MNNWMEQVEFSLIALILKGNGFSDGPYEAQGPVSGRIQSCL
jgi:hypothetical protein